jgi:hypothetical protein
MRRDTGEGVLAVEVEADRLGVEVRAVVEGHALFEGEDVGRVVRLLPALGEERGGVGGAGHRADEALEHLARDAERLAVARERGVEAGRVSRRAEDERRVDVAALVLSATFVALTGAGGEDDRADGDRGNAGEPAPSRSVEHVLCTFHVVWAPLHVIVEQRCAQALSGV